ncbi:major facilitator superfamily domain-containing protein [Phakopsora pachyrhizi]|uniref:Major facilitator superfamily domain-containing protein n=1 Tax=Phakopsora pachyrhizi TaxID=170000 RepID=A0AAV0BNH8_PHAPC|nr:major facilitator superfamily domain-containing protein [Phakopsora pachyrhizi]
MEKIKMELKGPSKADFKDKESKLIAENKEEDYKHSKILQGKELFLTFLGMLMSVFLTALDQTILSPAIPVIASEFHSLDKIAWFITQLSSSLLHGQILTIFSRKKIFSFAIGVFTVGSLICGTARSLLILLVGRAVAGYGAGGIIVSCVSIIADVTKLEDRPKLLSSFGVVHGISSICGPLLGGWITDHFGWRWCFWCNLPFGAIAIAINTIFLTSSNSSKVSTSLHERSDQRWRKLTFGKFHPSYESFWHKIGTLDFIGAVLISSFIALLVLALQWGGNDYAWSDKAVILTFLGSFLCLITFLVWELKGMGKTQEGALIPFRLFRNRTQIGATLQSIFVMMNDFLPIQFRAMRHSTATVSGLQLIPMMLTAVLINGACGYFVSSTGLYLPPMILGTIFLIISPSLMTSLNEFSSILKIFGFEVVLGVGFGLLLQTPLVSVQANVLEEDIPQASGLISFGRFFGGVLGVTLAQTVFEMFLEKGLGKMLIDSNNYPTSTEIPSIKSIKSSIEIIYQFPDGKIRSSIIRSYAFALRRVYFIGVPCGIAAFLANFLIKNRNIKKKYVLTK